MKIPLSNTPNDTSTADGRLTVLYARVTREESVEKGLSLPNQRKRFEELAEQLGWDPTDVFAEKKGVSGELPVAERPALEELFQAVEQGQVERVVVRHLDRLGRGDVLVPILKELHEHDVDVWTFDGPVDARTAAGRFVTRVQAAAGAFETERGGERVREAKRGRARDGIHIGRAPFGYTSQSRVRTDLLRAGVSSEESRIRAQQEIPVSPGLTVDSDEADVVREIFRRCIDEGEGTRQIANDLNSRGILRRGGRWHPFSVTKILRDPKVAGWTTFDEEAYQGGRPCSLPIYRQERFEGQHEAIISKETFDRAQRLLGLRRERFEDGQKKSRGYPLSGLLYDAQGHPMSGKSSRKENDRWAYYICRKRASLGLDSESGGCDFPTVPAEKVERAVLEIISGLLSSPETVTEAWDAAVKKLSNESPERELALKKLDEEISGLERERESAFSGLRDLELAPDQYLTIADRAKELNERIRRLQKQGKEVSSLVVPIKPRQLSLERVAEYFQNLAAKLQEKPTAFQELVHLLHVHHGLRIVALDKLRVQLQVFLEPTGFIPKGRGTGVPDLQTGPKIPIVIEKRFGKPRLSNEQWAAKENDKGHSCACGCGKRIKVRPDMRAKTVGIPKYIQGHHKMNMTAFVEELNAGGFLTVAQAAKELGIGENTLRRAEGYGWIVPEWREWGTRFPMRVYKKEDLPSLREQMKKAGFRFRDDDSILTTREMAEALGISQSYLRHLERKGKVPKPDRDTNGKRMWKRGDVSKLRRKLETK